MPEHIEEIALSFTPSEDGLVYVPGVLTELGFAPSGGEARRLIDGGGVKISGVALESGEYHVDATRLVGQVIQVGKRKFARIKG